MTLQHCTSQLQVGDRNFNFNKIGIYWMETPKQERFLRKLYQGDCIMGDKVTK